MDKITCPACTGRGYWLDSVKGAQNCCVCNGEGIVDRNYWNELRHKSMTHDELMQEKFYEVFDRQLCGFDEKIIHRVTGRFSLDVVAFDDYCLEHLGYTEEEHGSLFDFCVHLGGKEMGDFVRSLI